MANDWHEDGVEADTEQQKIKINIEKTHHSHHRDYEHDKENNYYSSEEENLLDDGKKGGMKKRYKEKVTEVKEDESAKKCYHPVKFVFKPVEELDSGMASVKIEQHESELTFVRTYPTGITNKAFASTYSHKKVSERLNESAWNDKYVEKIKGYFVSNSAKHSVRLQTDEGSYYVRSLDSTWVWAKEITRLWVPERFAEWPEWSLYPEEVAEEKKEDAEDEFERME